MVPGQVDDRLADEVIWVAGICRCSVEPKDHRDRIRRVRSVVAEDRPHVLDLRGRVRQNAAVEVRPECLESELERGGDPEVPARAAKAPEELGLVGLGCANEAAVGGHYLHGSHVVDRQPEPALEPADATTEGQPGHAGVADDADRADEAMGLCRNVKLPEERPAVRLRRARPRIGLDAAHVRQVDHEAAVVAGEARGAVAAGLHDDLEVALTSERNRRSDLLRSARPGDHRGPAVMDRVPEPTYLVVRRVVGGDDVGARAPELIDVVGGDARRSFNHAFESRSPRPTRCSDAASVGGEIPQAEPT